MSKPAAATESTHSHLEPQSPSPLAPTTDALDTNSDSHVVLTPTSASSTSSANTPRLSTTPASNVSSTLDLNILLHRKTNSDMDTARENNTSGETAVVDSLSSQTSDPEPSSVLDPGAEPVATTGDKEKDQTEQKILKKKKRSKCKKHGKKKEECCGAQKAVKKEESSGDSSSSDSDSSDSGSEDEKAKRKRKKKKALKKKKAKAKKSKKHESESDSSDSGSDSDSSDSSSEEEERKRKKKKSKAKKRNSRKHETDSEHSDTDSSADESETDSEEEERKKKKKKKAVKKKAKAKAKKKRSKKYDTESESSDSDSESESDSDSEEEKTRRKRRHRKSRKAEESSASEAEAEAETQDKVPDEELETQLRNQLAQLQLSRLTQATQGTLPTPKKKGRRPKKPKKPAKRASTLGFKRVDQLWDSTIHNYKLTESAEDQVDEFDEYVFCVRRKFDWENKYRNTVVDIKSKPLRDALQEVMKDVKGVSLVEDQPSIDPNMLFLYLEEIKTYYRKQLRAQMKKEKKKKLKKRLSLQIAHCKLLAGYLDEDYEETKKTLYPMLEAGNITFDLLWALFKPNTIAYTTTYGSTEDPRCFKVDYANKESSFMRGEWYGIEGRYLEYDGKKFGLGEYESQIEAFKGARKITSLAAYPLEYHRDPQGVRKELIERGKKFVGMQGMNYRACKGLAFMKKKRTVAKININGRVMIDPAIFRRINPNYPIASFKPKEEEENPFNMDDSDDEGCGCADSDSEDDGLLPGAEGPLNLEESQEKTRYKVVVDKDQKVHYVEVSVDQDGNDILPEKQLDSIGKEDETTVHSFSEEELLIASPVVLGFAFSEKLWLEFPLSGIHEIEWNHDAFASIVLPKDHKWMVKGMVASHKFHAAKTIDDVVQGKGRGLVFLLHGPPGVGKTLTAEGIAEYLKVPLYVVSAGELGTEPARLEMELNRVMDITHSWGAVLLLDEADVFLERREAHDIHRNALVSIFLRELEYFQGILFLTTNRVETFDDAFQSRISMALKYGALNPKQRKEIWKKFVELVRVTEKKEKENQNKVKEGEKDEVVVMEARDGVAPADEKKEAEVVEEVWPFQESDFVELAKKEMNGRQIKNAVRTAQSIALSENKPFSMQYIRGVLGVMEDFDNDVRGYGFKDAMNHYT